MAELVTKDPLHPGSGRATGDFWRPALNRRLSFEGQQTPAISAVFPTLGHPRAMVSRTRGLLVGAAGVRFYEEDLCPRLSRDRTHRWWVTGVIGLPRVIGSGERYAWHSDVRRPCLVLRGSRCDRSDIRGPALPIRNLRRAQCRYSGGSLDESRRQRALSRWQPSPASAAVELATFITL